MSCYGHYFIFFSDERVKQNWAHQSLANNSKTEHFGHMLQINVTPYVDTACLINDLKSQLSLITAFDFIRSHAQQRFRWLWLNRKSLNLSY